MRLFLDESGQTGDLTTIGGDFGFGGQPHFVLCAIGPTSDEAMLGILGRVARDHRLKMAEIKSKKLKNRPWVARDIAFALRDARIPIFIEAVDKRFYLLTQIVNYHIMSASTLGSEGDQFIRNVFADFLYDYLPDGILSIFIEACVINSVDATRTSLEGIHSWATVFEGQSSREKEVARAIQDSLAESLDDFRIAICKNVSNYQNFLPIPDNGKKTAIYWVLPHYSSLTNIYARLNHHAGGKIGNIILVHDQQTQYDDVLREAMRAAEKLDNSELGPIFLEANYSFNERAVLEFANSKDAAGLVVADVIGGHVRRMLFDHEQSREIHEDAWTAFDTIWCAPDTATESSINFVLPTASIQRLQRAAIKRKIS